MRLAGVDIGGTKIAVAVGSDQGVLESHTVFPTAAVADPEAGLDRIAAAIRELAGQGAEPVVAVGIGSPGPLSARAILRSPNLPQWENVDLVDGLQQRLALPVFLENDASAAALGEWRFGAGRGYRHMVYVTVSTGIGSGLILDGRLYRGATGNAGEFGHWVLQPGGPLCGCGNHGCLEALASGTAIARMGRENRAGSPVLKQTPLEHIDAAAVFAAARSGDAVATAVIVEAATYLGRGLAMLVNLCNPQRVVLGGGVMQEGAQLLEPVKRALAAFALPALAAAAELVPAALAEESGVLGAMAVAEAGWRAQQG